ncbi:MAG: hypothetical protein ABR875_04100 [Minisyncoccia bacterium]|jgi:hypothetical protein
MDFNQLKELARNLGGILVMNGNTPEFVVLPFEKYQKIENGFSGDTPNACEEENAAIEKLNREILVLKEEIRQKEEAELIEEEEMPAETDETEMKVE